MSEAITKIKRLEHRVLWRMRLLTLQDLLVLAMIISAFAGAGFVAIGRSRALTMPIWTIIAAMSLVFLGALIRWFMTRESEVVASFLIDESLKLEDRIATSHLIIGRGGPTGALEGALIEDAASRLDDQHASAIVPFRTQRWYALLPLSAIVFTAAFMIPERSLPVDQQLATERADIETAGEILEKTAVETEQLAPQGTETATLAKEQAEIGRGFRRALATRSEALRRLSALEERIGRRHDDLKSTRAEEIVQLADRRIGNTLATLSTARNATAESAKNPQQPLDDQTETATKGTAKETQSASTDNRNAPAASAATDSKPGSDVASPPPLRAGQAKTDGTTNSGQKQAAPRNGRQEPISGQRNRNSSDSNSSESTKPEPKDARKADGLADGRDKQKTVDSGAGDPKPTSEGTKPGDQNADQSKTDDQKATLPAESADLLKSVPDSLAQQAAKAMPKISAELLKKAAELRANELSPQDIEKLRKAAEALAGDLTQIAQSKELQKALQEMARQARPEQIEQVARELGNQEKLKQELEASARLLSENQQAKDLVAGLAGELANKQREGRRNENNPPVDGKSDTRNQQLRKGDQRSGGDRTSGGGGPERMETGERIAGRGQETSIKGKLQRRAGGEYLYLQSKAGVGAARAPYSSVYPQYRREAERSVQRSQVPPNLRSVVRKYFDAINPDAKRP